MAKRANVPPSPRTPIRVRIGSATYHGSLHVWCEDDQGLMGLVGYPPVPGLSTSSAENRPDTHLRFRKTGGIMTTARDIMTEDATCVQEGDTLTVAARKMRDLDVGSLPICGDDKRLMGVLTDRDIVVKVIAEGSNPEQTTAGDLAQGEAVTIGADDDISEALRTMAQHEVRRLPVIDGHDLVGIIAQADVARELGDDEIAKVLREVST